MKSFQEALDHVFEEKASGFSPQIRELLRKVFDQGVLEGRAQERLDTQRNLPLHRAVRSACGKYLCLPVQTLILHQEQHHPGYLPLLLRHKDELFKKSPSYQIVLASSGLPQPRGEKVMFGPDMWRAQLHGSFNHLVTTSIADVSPRSEIVTPQAALFGTL